MVTVDVPDLALRHRHSRRLQRERARPGSAAASRRPRPRVHQIREVHRPQTAGLVVISRRRILRRTRRRAILRPRRALVRSAGDVVKRQRIRCRVPTPACTASTPPRPRPTDAGLLIDDRQHARKNRRSETRSSGDGQILRARIAKSAVATCLLSGAPRRRIAGAIQIASVVRRRVERNIRHQPKMCPTRCPVTPVCQLGRDAACSPLRRPRTTHTALRTAPQSPRCRHSKPAPEYTTSAELITSLPLACFQYVEFAGRHIVGRKLRSP